MVSRTMTSLSCWYVSRLLGVHVVAAFTKLTTLAVFESFSMALFIGRRREHEPHP